MRGMEDPVMGRLRRLGPREESVPTLHSPALQGTGPSQQGQQGHAARILAQNRASRASAHTVISPTPPSEARLSHPGGWALNWDTGNPKAWEKNTGTRTCRWEGSMLRARGGKRSHFFFGPAV